MTHDEMQAAIRRLLALDKPDMYIDVLDALMGRRGWTIGDARDTLVSLLKDADMTEWPDETLDYFGLVRLPVDANGEPICMGDTVYREGFAMRVTGIHLGEPTYIYANDVDSNSMTEKYKSLPEQLTHAPLTVEDVLKEFVTWLRGRTGYAKTLQGAI